MALRDVLLYLPVHPEPPPAALVGYAVALAARSGAHLTALAQACELAVPVRLRDSGAAVEDAVRQARERERALAAALLEAAEAGAAGVGVGFGRELETCGELDAPELAVAAARLHDLTVSAPPGGDDAAARALLFGSGRPLLLVPRGHTGGFRLETALVAWDGTRAAVRAVREALPLLALARKVHIVSALEPHDRKAHGDGVGLARHLARHAIATEYHEPDATRRPIDAVLRDFARDLAADLLVMGAFGHSRARAFFLGSATRALLPAPPVPTLMAH